MEKNKIKEKIQILINHFNAGNFRFVIKETEKLLIKLPDNIFLINLIGSSYQNLGDHETAIKTFLHILNLDNKNIAAYNNLGNVFKNMKNFEEAKINYEKALEINPNFVNARTNYGNLFFELNNYEAAITNLKKAIHIDNKSVQPYYNLGVVYQSIGETEKALQNFEMVLKLAPYFTNADKMISRFTKYSKNHHHIKQMEDKIRNQKLNHSQKSQLHFALGKAYEDFGEFGTSFQNIKLGNYHKKKFIKYDLSDDLKTFKELKAFFSKYNFQSNSKNLKEKKIIFIIGLPRSGTSLVEQIMSSHSKIYGCGELDYMTKLITENLYTKNILDNDKINKLSLSKKDEIAKNYINYVEKFQPNSLIYTDKAPLNFIWVGIIKILLPNSKIIHCKRNSKDNILSLYKNDFDDRLNFSYDFDDLFKFYKEYRELMDLWKTKLNKEIYDVEYENIINNPETEIKKLLKFCELDFEENCLNFYKNKRPIKTVSSAQARRPLYNKSINSYKNFEIYMKDIFQQIDNFK